MFQLQVCLGIFNGKNIACSNFTLEQVKDLGNSLFSNTDLIKSIDLLYCMIQFNYLPSNCCAVKIR